MILRVLWHPWLGPRRKEGELFPPSCAWGPGSDKPWRANFFCHPGGSHWGTPADTSTPAPATTRIKVVYTRAGLVFHSLYLGFIITFSHISVDFSQWPATVWLEHSRPHHGGFSKMAHLVPFAGFHQPKTQLLLTKIFCFHRRDQQEMYNNTANFCHVLLYE